MNKFLSQIEHGIKTNQSIGYFEMRLKDSYKFFPCMEFPAINTVFRARMALKNELFKNITELKYPPSKLVYNKGRFNDINESMTYLSTGEKYLDGLGATYYEIGGDLYQQFCLTTWQYSKRDINFYISGMLATYQSNNKDLLEFLSYFNKLLTSSDKKYYNATIAFARAVLKNYPKVINKKFGIIYNSIYQSQANRNLYNLALTPEVFDDSFKIDSAEYILMRFNPEKETIDITNLNTAKISPNGELIWEKSFIEMKKYCDIEFKNDLFISVDDETKNMYIIMYPYGDGKIINQTQDNYIVEFKHYGTKLISKTINFKKYKQTQKIKSEINN